MSDEEIRYVAHCIQCGAIMEKRKTEDGSPIWYCPVCTRQEARKSISVGGKPKGKMVDGRYIMDLDVQPIALTKKREEKEEEGGA